MSKEYQSLIASEGYLWFVSKPLQMLASTNRSTVSDTPGPPMGAGGRAQKFPTRQRLVAPQTIQTALIGHRWAPERWQVQFQPPTVKQVTYRIRGWLMFKITTNKASGGDGIPAELFQILKDDVVKVLHSICQQIWKSSSGKGQFSFQSQRKAMPKNAQTTTQLHSSHTLVK